uniref:thiamine pyrophosphate-binding protein n=1 Tax=Desertihabitans aurantiacus TaxID=2282477 RepID=UPI0022B7E9E4
MIGAHPESITAATTVVSALVAGGVTDVVVSPGSRSAPLAYAVEAAERGGLLRLHVRIDERSAAFTALGMARASGRPVPVITTSGTAVANLHPAVLEASHAHVPLVLLTADRPAAVVGTGANQTTQQVAIFGEAVRAGARLSVRPVEALTGAVRRLLAAATGVRTGTPGPVHLNLELTEPLVPDRPLDPLDA